MAKHIDRKTERLPINDKNYVIERPCISTKRIVKKDKDRYIRLKKEELISMLYIDISAIIKKLKDNYNIWISNIKKEEQMYEEKLYAQKKEQKPME